MFRRTGGRFCAETALESAANPLEMHEYRRCRIARQGEDDQQISGPRLRGSRLLWPYPRPPAQGRLGRPRRRLPDALGGRPQVQPAHERHRPRAQGRRQADPGHRPGPRGRGDLLARAGSAQGKEGAQGPAGRARGVQRHHQAGHPRGDEAPAQDRRRAGRCLSRPPRARLSGRLHALARALAQAAGRALGRPRAVGRAAAGLRPRAGNREIRRQGILVDRGHAGDPAQRDLRGAPGRRRRPEDPAARHRLRRGSRSLHPRSRKRSVPRRQCRSQARAPQSAAAVHHLDHAAGGLAQARLCAGHHHASCPAAL